MANTTKDMLRHDRVCILQVAGQLQALLQEKARLASENARLAHENTSLQVIAL